MPRVREHYGMPCVGPKKHEVAEFKIKVCDGMHCAGPTAGCMHRIPLAYCMPYDACLVSDQRGTPRVGPMRRASCWTNDACLMVDNYGMPCVGPTKPAVAKFKIKVCDGMPRAGTQGAYAAFAWWIVLRLTFCRTRCRQCSVMQGFEV